MVAHQRAEEIGQLLQRRLGAPRLCPDQGQNGVQAVEQEMRTDTRRQGLEPRLGQRWRKGFDAQRKIEKHGPGHQPAQERRAQHALPAPLVHRHETPEIKQQRGGSGRQQHHDRLRDQGRQTPQKRTDQRQQREIEQQQGLHPGRHVDIALQTINDSGALHQRPGQGKQVHAEQDAQHDAEIAEVRERLPRRVLPYT